MKKKKRMDQIKGLKGNSSSEGYSTRQKFSSGTLITVNTALIDFEFKPLSNNYYILVGGKKVRIF